MPSPFPGMDPFLEGHVWPDVHHSLAAEIKTYILPLVVPRYLVRIATYIVSDTAPEEDIGIMYPDVELLQKRQSEVKEAALIYAGASPPITPATITIPTVESIDVRIPRIEIVDRDYNKLVTAIEILSSVNKRRPGLKTYRSKRSQLHKDGVHLLEIDLLRRGQRPFQHPSIPKSDYLITLLRGDQHTADVWAINIDQALPVVPVPLKKPDPDIALDLQTLFITVYDKSFYGLSVNYSETPPPPVFDAGQGKWIKKQIEEWTNRSLPPA